MSNLTLRVTDPSGATHEFALTAAVSVGRQQAAASPHALVTTTVPHRLIIAPLQEIQNQARKHLTLEPRDDGTVVVRNLAGDTLDREDGPALARDVDVPLTPPFALRVGSRRLAVRLASTAGADAGSGENDFANATLAPGSLYAGQGPASVFATQGAGTAAPIITTLPQAQQKQLTEWLRRTLVVLQSALGSENYLADAARAMVDIIRLDTGRVLLRDGAAWRTVVAYPAGGPGPEWEPSQTVVNQVLESRAPTRRKSDGGGDPSSSLQGLSVVVAAPILDAGNQVRGLLYGERRDQRGEGWLGDRLETVLVELLASGIAAGLVRQEQQAAAVQAWTRFGEFFGASMATELRRQPDLLAARETEVTCMFCDIRGFSAVNEKHRPPEVLEWINDVLNSLSEIVLDRQGVLVDYVGDELFAMWVVPVEQADQATRAVEAGLAVRAALDDLNRRWETRLGGRMDVGVGINTGPACVGNVGCKLKFKYGPLGNTVNLASRVQGLTKYLRCGLLVTEFTKQHLGNEFMTRRVVKTVGVGMANEVVLYEVERAGSRSRERFFRESVEALDALEAKDFLEAVRLVGRLLLDNPEDGPLLLTLARATQALTGGGFDTVWRPPGK